MVIVKLIGGIGNQLFQYALGRRLSLLHDVALKLDTSQYKTDNFRKYNLGVFNIIEDFATVDDIKKTRKRLLFEKILPYWKRSNLYEHFYYYDPKILQARKNVYLEGYWQSESYFKDIEDIIRREFTIKVKPDPDNEQITSLIKNVTSVSLHLRRTDYVSNKAINQFHGTCDLTYYRQAVEMIAQKTSTPHFFVFSDDISWAKKNLSLGYPTVFVSHNNNSRDFEDLRLITQCNHHITANSTFSWWGAWLNQKNNKIVIAPKRWFKEESKDTKDLIPKEWIRI